ncbi:MAG: hypothetical protein R6U63_02385, partial [Longimicrobiales bacterium]
MRRLQLVAIALAVVLLVVLALGWALLGTTRGARFALDIILVGIQYSRNKAGARVAYEYIALACL